MQVMISNAEVPTKKEKITFTCEKETRDFLEKWAAEDGRSLSNLVERIVTSAIESKTLQQ